MFSPEGLTNIRKVRWPYLKPGQIILVGVSVNNTQVPELADFPVITPAFLRTLSSKYLFLKDREFIVADALPGARADKAAQALRENDQTRERLNQARQIILDEKKNLQTSLKLPSIDSPLYEIPEVSEKKYLVKNRLNSFQVDYGKFESGAEIPSFFNHISLGLTLSDLLTGRLHKEFNFPEDRDVLVHLGVDFSKSMESGGKLDLIISALNYFSEYYTKLLDKTKIIFYPFSDECKPMDYPLHPRAVSHKETKVGSFFKKVLRNRDSDCLNKVILFTDGRPSDRPEAMRLAGLLKKNKVDYTQVIFEMREDCRHEVLLPDGVMGANIVDNVALSVEDDMEEICLSDEELDEKMTQLYEDFTEIAQTASGNQIILKANDIIRVLSVEIYDRYLGLLTLATGIKSFDN